jgi:hypothetical protein
MRHRVPGARQRGSVTVLMAGMLFLAGVLTLAAVDPRRWLRSMPTAMGRRCCHARASPYRTRRSWRSRRRSTSSSLAGIAPFGSRLVP